MTPKDVSDLEAYKKLVASATELEALAERCASPASETAIATAAIAVRNLASALYRASLSTLGNLDADPTRA